MKRMKRVLLLACFIVLLVQLDWERERIYFVSAIASLLLVFSSKTQRRHRLTAFLDTLRFAQITLYDVDLVISRLPIGEPVQKGNAFLNPFDLYSVLPDFEKRALNDYYFGLVRRIEAEDADLPRQFPEQFRHSLSPNRVGGRIAFLGGD